jgi:hypothetical protein
MQACHDESCVSCVCVRVVRVRACVCGADRVPQDETIAEEEAAPVDDGGSVEDEHRHAGHQGQRELRVDVKEQQRGLVPGERRTSLVEPARRPCPTNIPRIPLLAPRDVAPPEEMALGAYPRLKRSRRM